MNTVRLAVFVVVALLVVKEGQAAPGDFDNSFGVNGIARLSHPSNVYPSAKDMLVQPDGKILIGGSVVEHSGGGPTLFSYRFGITRLLPNGALDSAFGGGDGVFEYDQSPYDELHGLALQADGRILAAGVTSTSGDFQSRRFTIFRLTATGALDDTFGAGGVVSTDFFADGYSEAKAIAVQPDGKILALGGAFSGGSSYLVLARYSVNGTLDSNFGKITSAGNKDPVGLAVLADGRIITASYRYGSYDANNEATGFELTITRRLSNGTPDPAFGSEGLSVMELPAESYVRDMALQADGKMVFAGMTVIRGGTVNESDEVADAYFFLVFARNSDGTPSGNFSQVGVGAVTQESWGGFQFPIGAFAVGVQPNGKIVAAGMSDYDNFDLSVQSTVIRYMPDGSLDESFGGGDGMVVPLFGPGEGERVPGAAAVQADGKILVAGEDSLARIEGDPVPLPSAIELTASGAVALGSLMLFCSLALISIWIHRRKPV